MAGDDIAPQEARAEFEFALTPQEEEQIRWYLEDYLEYPEDPAPENAARAERLMAEKGSDLFRAVFQQSDDARDLWAVLSANLDEFRVEIITDVEQAFAIPWELLRDPTSDTPLALRAQTFVRAQPNAALTPRVTGEAAECVRILLVICRPGRENDVPFRSVAIRLVRSLTADARAVFDLDVLRPPTFEHLSEVLRAASDAGEPYHIVHFDGHGTHADLSGHPHLLQAPAEPGPHGYLSFENPVVEDNSQFVDGTALGRLLYEAKVSALILNACRSAHSETPEEPDAVGLDPHSQVRGFGSLAQAIMDQGVPAVVAMRYNVWVVTAAQFVSYLYSSLVQGHAFGDAVAFARRQLAAQPLRTIAFEPRPLQDWCVPVVYEVAPIRLFPKPIADESLNINVEASTSLSAEGTLDPELPRPPDVGFFGRDETLLALDRAFDDHQIVLLHGYAGCGKTTTVAEFARWYSLTGGVEGPVLFTRFEQYRPLAQVLSEIERVFGPVLEQAGVQWLTLDDEQRREVALDVLRQIPVLWIWDNIEPIAGFPEGTESAWSPEEQTELLDFLRDARETKAKFLLTSRRGEQGWLDDLPFRVTMPPMPEQESFQLAAALAKHHGHDRAEIATWRPLLQFAGGNPMTITVVVRQALRDRLTTPGQIEHFVEQLRAGAARIDDEADQGRDRSLGASLSYGFEHAFTEEERAQLALLHLFQGFVDVRALCVMGVENQDWCLPEVRGLTPEHGIALLDRATEIGLLTAHGGGCYSIHPALPWYLRDLFDQHYAERVIGPSRAFVEATGYLGSSYHDEYQDGNRDVISALQAEEQNLLHAWRLARHNQWWRQETIAMQGLRQVYVHTGRRAEWARLVHDTAPDFVDPDTDLPLPGREDDWGLITEYIVSLAIQQRDWPEAERLQRLRVDWNRDRTTAALVVPPKELDDAQRNEIRTLAMSIQGLGIILCEQSDPECRAALEESYKLLLRIGDEPGASITALNLGNAYLDVPDVRDLDEAKRWYKRSLNLRSEDDSMGRGQSLGQLGLVARERFKEARAADRPEPEVRDYLNQALCLYHQALDLIPVNAIGDLAVTHMQLGNTYRNVGDLNRALYHYRKCVRYEEGQRNPHGAARARVNVALLLANAARFGEALDWANAALRDYQTLGDHAAVEIDKTQGLIAEIEEGLAVQQSSPDDTTNASP